MPSLVATIYLGRAVRNDSVAIAAVPAGMIAPAGVERAPNSLAIPRRFCEWRRTQDNVDEDITHVWASRLCERCSGNALSREGLGYGPGRRERQPARNRAATQRSGES
jgi:hypothetical protein